MRSPSGSCTRDALRFCDAKVRVIVDVATHLRSVWCYRVSVVCVNTYMCVCVYMCNVCLCVFMYTRHVVCHSLKASAQNAQRTVSNRRLSGPRQLWLRLPNFELNIKAARRRSKEIRSDPLRGRRSGHGLDADNRMQFKLAF